MAERNFSSIPIEQLYVQLQSSDKGIPAALAEQRVKEQLKYFKKTPRFKKELGLLIRQFVNPLILLLVIAVLLSAVLGESSDSFIILFILIATGLLGFWQELNAGRAMEKLRNMIEMKHTVVRNGQQQQLPTDQIVSGDILLFDAGDMIPADCRIIESNELHINESSLTGESYPVEKLGGQVADELPLSKKYNCLWKGAKVIGGSETA